MHRSPWRFSHPFLAACVLSMLGFQARAASPAAPDEDSIWVEGEDATEKQVTPNPWYSEAVRKEQMSGGRWLSHFSATADGTARYDVTAAKDGDYVLWVRANPVASALAYQVNGGAWTEIDTKNATDVVNLAVDDKPDLRFLGWMRGGTIPLKKGPLSIAFKMHSGPSHHGAIDCFVLTTRPYEPRGFLKPGEVQPLPVVPALSDANLRHWIDFIRPADDDKKWERLDWRNELSGAVEEAKRLQRPILLWAMNGHPLGCT